MTESRITVINKKIAMIKPDESPSMCLSPYVG